MPRANRFSAIKPRSGVEATDEKTARRGNSAYRQFSAYIPEEMYRRLKVRSFELGLDLSEAVERSIADWLPK